VTGAAASVVATPSFAISSHEVAAGHKGWNDGSQRSFPSPPALAALGAKRLTRPHQDGSITVEAFTVTIRRLSNYPIRVPV
jgi:hypothetical protein